MGRKRETEMERYSIASSPLRSPVSPSVLLFSNLTRRFERHALSAAVGEVGHVGGCAGREHRRRI